MASTSFSQDLRERLEVERQVGRTVSLDVSTYACQIYQAPSDDESEDTLPRSSLNAPIEALQDLANAAAEAAAVPSTSPPM